MKIFAYNFHFKTSLSGKHLNAIANHIFAGFSALQTKSFPNTMCSQYSLSSFVHITAIQIHQYVTHIRSTLIASIHIRFVCFVENAIGFTLTSHPSCRLRKTQSNPGRSGSPAKKYQTIYIQIQYWIVKRKRNCKDRISNVMWQCVFFFGVSFKQRHYLHINEIGTDFGRDAASDFIYLRKIV